MVETERPHPFGEHRAASYFQLNWQAAKRRCIVSVKNDPAVLVMAVQRISCRENGVNNFISVRSLTINNIDQRTHGALPLGRRHEQKATNTPYNKSHYFLISR